MQNMTAERKLEESRMMLVRRWPFFAQLALNMKMVEAPWHSTMATDGVHCYWNRGFVLATPIEELCGVLAHEGTHVGLAHHARRATRDHKLWNESTDFAANLIIRSGKLELPDGALLSDEYAGMSAEQIYRARERSQQEQSGRGGKGSQGQAGSAQNSPGKPGNGKPEQSGPGAPQAGQQPRMVTAPDGRQCLDMPGAVMDMPGKDGGAPSPAELAQAVQAAAAMMESAAQAARRRGDMPGALRSAIAQERQSREDWREVLPDWCDQLSSSDWSWRRPNRRFIGDDIYLPSLTDRTMGELVAVIDTSGSVTPQDLAVFAGALRPIHATYRPTQLHVMYVSNRVHHVDSFGPDDEITMERHGSGGTAFQPAFDYVEQQGIQPVGLIYLTDLAGDTPRDPGYNVLWISVDPRGKTPAFGRRVDLI